MGIFSGLFRFRDKPQNRTTGSAYSFFFGSSSAGKRVNERSAMQMTAVYSCVRILAEAVAGLPLHLYRYKEDGGKEKAIDHPLYLLLHDEPNPEMSSFVFRETLMTHLLLWGNAYAQIIRNGKGEVIALYPLMPDRMTVDRDRDGKLYYEYTVSTDDAPTVKGTVVRLKSSDVLHIPGLGFDGLVGYSPIAMAKNAIGMAIACEEYGAKFFANGSDWSIQQNLQNGDVVSGDRTYAFTSVPSQLLGAEWIRTACDSKKYVDTKEEATFTVGADAHIYIGMDTRVGTPNWLAGWEKTDLACTDNGNPIVTYEIYQKSFAAGETVSLGTIGMNTCVNYVVFALPDLVMLQRYLLGVGKLTDWTAGDLCADGCINGLDLALMRQRLTVID